MRRVLLRCESGLLVLTLAYDRETGWWAIAIEQASCEAPKIGKEILTAMRLPRLLSLLVLLPALAIAAPPTVTITGSVRDPSGAGVTSGRITCKLSQPGSVLDGATSVRVAAQTTITLTAGGTLPATAKLVPNSGAGSITPAGTAYLCTFVVVLASGLTAPPWTEAWDISSSPATIDIGAILRVSTGGVTFLAGPAGPTGPTGPTGPQGPSVYDVMLSWIGRPIASELLARVEVATAFTIPSGCTGAQASVGTNPTATATVTFKKNGFDAGSVAFATNGTPTFTCAAPIALAAGDLLSFHAQASADATLADLSITLQGAP